MGNQNWKKLITFKKIKSLERTLEQKSVLKNKTAALIIDMQEDFIRNIEDSERTILLDSHLEMIKFLATNNIPTIVLEYIGHQKTYEVIKQEINKFSLHEYIEKNGNDGFSRKVLQKTLKEWGIQNLILMGINASYCVKDTAISALKKGYNIYTARQLIANQDYRQERFKQDVPSWYEENGTYFSNFKELTKKLVN